MVETQKLCPTGWHMPSDAEWKQLEYYLGMTEAQTNEEGFRGTNEGGMMKTTTLWEDPNTGASDELHFSIIPSGRRGEDGVFVYGANTAFFWLSEIGPWGVPHRRHFKNDEGRISRSGGLREFAFSVRCLKD